MADRINHWLTSLFRSHHRDLLKFATRLMGDRDAGEEVVQDTYLRLSRRSADALVIDRPINYAYTAARTAAIDLTARRHSEWLYRIEFDSIDQLASADDTFQIVDRRQQVIRMAVFLNELPKACQTAFIMNKVEGRSHKEIAERLGVSVSMVEKHMMRAMKHCRDLMREVDPECFRSR